MLQWLPHFLQVWRHVRRNVSLTQSALFFFHIDNLQGIEFLESFNKSTLVSDLAHRATDIVFFTFWSTVTANDVDYHFPSTILSLDSPFKII